MSITALTLGPLNRTYYLDENDALAGVDDPVTQSCVQLPESQGEQLFTDYSEELFWRRLLLLDQGNSTDELYLFDIGNIPNAGSVPYAVTFDLDGTIFNSAKLHEKAWRQAASILGYPWPTEIDFTKQAFGYSGIDTARILFPGRDSQAVLNLKNVLYPLILKTSLLRELVVPGFYPLFDSLRSQHIPIALVTGSNPDEIPFILGQLGLCGQFDVIVDGSQTVRQKPEGDPYFLALQKLGYPASRVIGFEDSIAGLKALNTARINTVAVGTSLSWEQVSARVVHVYRYINEYGDVTLGELSLVFGLGRME